MESIILVEVEPVRDTINIAGVIPESFTDGPGIRYTIFTQGCRHHCKNCHNPETWDFNAGKTVDIQSIYNDILENPMLDGITFSGGDPLYQPESCANLAKMIKENTDLNIWLYTGFTFDEVVNNPDYEEILKYLDVIVDGMYDEQCRSLHLRFRGSSNQRIINVPESLKLNKIVLMDI